VEDHHRQFYFEALDLAVMSIEDWFNQPSFIVYKNLEDVFIKVANKDDYRKELQEILSFYGDGFDPDELSTLFDIFGSNFTKDDSIVSP